MKLIISTDNAPVCIRISERKEGESLEIEAVGEYEVYIDNPYCETGIQIIHPGE